MELLDPERNRLDRLDEEDGQVDDLAVPTGGSSVTGGSVTHPVAIPVESIDADALKVIHRLTRHGHEAYLVGGCVRDLLLDFRPKDFDIATSAWPGEIRELFRNCRIIGRRFRLAHILFAGKFIEVSTFRGNAAEAAEAGGGEDLLIREDNVFGSPEEDARRRDFTCNALFYDVERQEIIDFVGGMEDIGRRMVCSIGDPQIRLREDPVRILRAVRFSARLGFECEQEIHQAIADVKDDLVKSAPPRVHEELLKTLASGASSACFRMLYETGVLQVLMPSISDAVEGAGGFLFPLLEALDRYDQGFRSLPDSALIAALLYPVYAKEADEQEDPYFWLEGLREGSPIFTSTRRRDIERILQVFRAQRRFAREAKARRPNLGAFIRKDYFQDAWLLFKLVSEVTGEHREFIEDWEPRLSGPRRPAPAAMPPQRYFTPAAPAPEGDEGGSDPLVRRRRRRGGRGRRRGGSFDAASGARS